MNAPTVVEISVRHFQDNVVSVRIGPAQEVNFLTGDEHPQTVLTVQTQLLNRDEPE